MEHANVMSSSAGRSPEESGERPALNDRDLDQTAATDHRQPGRGDRAQEDDKQSRAEHRRCRPSAGVRHGCHRTAG